jgi:hypothetical protein
MRLDTSEFELRVEQHVETPKRVVLMEIELRLLAFGIHHVEQVEQNAERRVLKEPKLHVAAATNVTACGNVRKDDQLSCGRSYCFPPLDTIPSGGVHGCGDGSGHAQKVRCRLESHTRGKSLHHSTTQPAPNLFGFLMDGRAQPRELRLQTGADGCPANPLRAQRSSACPLSAILHDGLHTSHLA